MRAGLAEGGREDSGHGCVLGGLGCTVFGGVDSSAGLEEFENS